MEMLRAMNAAMVECRIPRSGTRSLAFWGIVFLVACYLFGPIWLGAMRVERGRVNDYYQDWGSARNYWAGLPIYLAHSASVPRHLGLPSNPMKSIEYNAHPPTSVLLALPLGRLDYPDAVHVWNLVSLAAFLAGLAIVAVALPFPRELIWPTCALLLFCHPIYGNFYHGQLTLLLVLLVASAWALDRSGRTGAAGLLIGIAAAVKLFPAYLLLYFAIQGRLRALAAAAASFAALTVATAAVLGCEAYRDYLLVVLPRQEAFRGCDYNAAIAGLWYKLFNPMADDTLIAPLWRNADLARYGTLLSDLAVTSIVAAVVRRARTPARRDLAFGLTMTAMLLVSPVTWDISLPMLLIPLAVIGRVAGRWPWMPIALMAVLIVFWVPQNILVGIEARLCRCRIAYSPAHMLGVPSVRFYALLATFALGLAAFRAQGKMEAAEVVVNSHP